MDARLEIGGVGQERAARGVRQLRAEGERAVEEARRAIVRAAIDGAPERCDASQRLRAGAIAQRGGIVRPRVRPRTRTRARELRRGDALHRAPAIGRGATRREQEQPAAIRRLAAHAERERGEREPHERRDRDHRRDRERGDAERQARRGPRRRDERPARIRALLDPWLEDHLAAELAPRLDEPHMRAAPRRDEDDRADRRRDRPEPEEPRGQPVRDVVREHRSEHRADRPHSDVGHHDRDRRRARHERDASRGEREHGEHWDRREDGADDAPRRGFLHVLAGD